MKLNKQKLKEINELYFQFKKCDKEIEAKNLLKEFYLKQIIKELKQTDFLKAIKNIEGVKSAQLRIWNDVENPSWKELEIKIQCMSESTKFKNYEDYICYEDDIRSRIYSFLDDYSDLNNFIMLYIER